MCENFNVGSLLDKLPPKWKSFALSLKHKCHSLTMDSLIISLQIEEKRRDKDKLSNEFEDKVNIVEGKNSNSKKSSQKILFVSLLFEPRLAKECTSMEESLMVSTPLKKVYVVKYKYCVVRIKDKDTMVNLVVLDSLDFDVIHGMDWLSPNYASVDCYNKLVKFVY